eukprot:6117745-Alexandrium_andersonii.AAC.1
MSAFKWRSRRRTTAGLCLRVCQSVCTSWLDTQTGLTNPLLNSGQAPMPNWTRLRRKPRQCAE